MQDCERTRNLCNVHQRQSTRSKPNTETLQSRRHSTRNLLQYRIHPLIHPHADLTFVQQLLVEQSCEKYTVKVATTGNYSLSTVVQSLLEWQQQKNAPIGVQTSANAAHPPNLRSCSLLLDVVGWLVFNGTFSTNRVHRGIGAELLSRPFLGLETKTETLVFRSRNQD